MQRSGSLAITFTEPMLLKPAALLPRGDQWLYELKFDGFRGVAVKDGSQIHLFSRNGRDLSKKFARIVEAVAHLKIKSAVIDGEIVCVDEAGRPCFEDLQNFTARSGSRLFFYAFDLLAADDVSLMTRPIEERKDHLRRLLPSEGPLRLSDFVECEPEALVRFARENRLEGIVAKRRGSIYEPGKRSGAWAKFKTLQEAEFVIGGFLPADNVVESICVGFRKADAFLFAAKLEVYLREDKRKAMAGELRRIAVQACPFARVPNRRPGDTWAGGLTAEEKAAMVWVEPIAPVKVRFVEWTRSGVLRHAQLVR